MTRAIAANAKADVCHVTRRSALDGWCGMSRDLGDSCSPLLNPRMTMPISCIFTSFCTFLHDFDLRLICVHQRQVLIFQFRRSLAIPAILAISRHPAPPPGFDPIRPKVNPIRPNAGVPNTRVFRVVGWKAESIGRGSQIRSLRSRAITRSRRALCATLPLPVIPISKALTPFLPIDPQLAVLQTNALNPIIPNRSPLARDALGFGPANC